ncbi:MAG TPA: acyltransferase [Lacunisphaera sp.]|nr:acyltransferase [Lacunisphaera sp.]
MPAPARNAFIDHLRVLTTGLVILHHTAIAYGGSGGWYWREQPNASSHLLLLFNATNQSWFMGFFFLLAGYYTPRSFDRKGPRAYLGDRFIRLGLPLAAYYFVLHPLTVALAYPIAGQSFGLRWWNLTKEHEFGPGPLWFAEALLIFALAYAAWRRWGPGPARDLAEWPSHRALLLGALGAGLASFLVRFAVPVGHNVFSLQLGYFPPYILLFAFGCLAARSALLERVSYPLARPWLMTSIFSFVGLLVMAAKPAGQGSFDGGWNLNAAFYALWDPLIGWGITLGLLWFFRTRLAGTNPFADALARRAFGAYIVHPPVVVALCLLARGWTAAPLLKFTVVGALACAASFAVASVLLLVPGVKKVI